MTLSREEVLNLASVFKYSFEGSTKDLRNLGMTLLKILDFSYDPYEGLKYREEPIEGYEGLRVSFRVTPVSLGSFDVDCIETALNKVGPTAVALSPLLDCIGWTLSKDENGYKVHFVGGRGYDVWREPGIPWDLDLDEETKDWRTGSDWVDGWDLKKDVPKKWTLG